MKTITREFSWTPLRADSPLFVCSLKLARPCNLYQGSKLIAILAAEVGLDPDSILITDRHTYMGRSWPAKYIGPSISDDGRLTFTFPSSRGYGYTFADVCRAFCEASLFIAVQKEGFFGTIAGEAVDILAAEFPTRAALRTSFGERLNDVEFKFVFEYLEKIGSLIPYQALDRACNLQTFSGAGCA